MPRWGMVFDLDCCTGCGACAVACAQESNAPLGDGATAGKRRIRWVEILPADRGTYPGHNPDVSTEKCSFCLHRFQRAREQAPVAEREFGPDDYRPACVAACPAAAMRFVDLDDGESAGIDFREYLPRRLR